MHLVASQIRDAGGGAEHAVAERVLLVVNAARILAGHRPWLVLVHLDLFENHLLLGVEVFLPQARAQDVREHVHRFRQVLGQHGRVVDGVLFAGVGVVAGPDAVEVQVHLQRGAARRALEHHVFEEVRHPRDLGRFVPAPGANEEPERDRPRRRARLADELQPVGKLVRMERHEGTFCGICLFYEPDG